MFRIVFLIALAAACISLPVRGSLAQESLWAEDADETFEVEPVMFQPGDVPAEEPPPPPRPSRRSARAQYVRLARAPNMFGESLGFGGQLITVGETQRPAIVDLPLGTGRMFRIAENNSPIPTDRFYFDYRSFQNALSSQILTGPTFLPQDANVDRYTLGFENTFWDGNASLDLRVPFVSSFDVSPGPDFGLSSGNFGDISLFYKNLLYADDMVAIAAGVGIGIPTSSDVEGRLGGSPFRLESDAVHILPYVGALVVPNDFWFFQWFLQLDFNANGNDVVAGDPLREQAVLTEQNLFHINLSGGYWLHENYDARYVNGIAAILELHYTTTIQDADAVAFAGGGDFIFLGNTFNRVDVLNMTAGLHFQIGDLSNLRVACVVPLRSEIENRQFDAETVVSFNRYF